MVDLVLEEMRKDAGHAFGVTRPGLALEFDRRSERRVGERLAVGEQAAIGRPLRGGEVREALVRLGIA
jgi:hypothetical protein